jgi:4-carboxymuconolactone decarboxylase
MAMNDDRPHTSQPLDEERLGRTYRAILGEIPPHVRTRWATLVAAGRARTVEAIEELRAVCIMDNPLDLRVQQLVQFGQLLVLRAEDPARLHARAAVRLGASVADLIGVAETAFITGGVTAFSLGVRVAGEVAEATDTGGGASR